MTASEKILQKALVGSNLDSRQWNSIQAGLRDRAFFSSQVASARILHAAREMVAERAGGNLSASEFRREMRKILGRDGYDAGENRGTIKDLMTKARLDVIQKTNVEQARGFIHHLEATAPGTFAAFPAQELIRVRQRRQPRDWAQRWKDNGGKFYEGRMVALIDDPIWTAISAFGNPFPPFDFGSGMGVRAVKKSEAVRLGVISADEVKARVEEMRQKPAPDFNGNLQATVPFKGANDPEWLRLKQTFGDQIVYKDGAIVWKGETMQGIANGEGTARLGKSTSALLSHFSGIDREHMENTSLTLSGEWVEQHAAKHIGTNEKDPRNIPLRPCDFELIPAMWRNPDNVARGKYAGSSVLQLETFDGGMLNLAIDHRSGAMPLSFWKTKKVRGQVT